MTRTPDDLPLLAFPDAESFDHWLAENLGAKGAWLKFAKKGARERTLGKAEAIDCALRHGWIDGQLGAFDDAHFLTRFTPRGRNSRWSAKNARRAEELIAQGLMLPRGLAEVEAAKADGRWQAAYPSASAIQTPPDFTQALGRSRAAAAAFEALDGANRYAFLYRLHHARDRARLIAELVAMLERGETFHPKRPSPRR